MTEPLKKRSISVVIAALLVGGVSSCCLYELFRKKYLDKPTELTVNDNRILKLADGISCLQAEIARINQRLDQQVSVRKFDSSRMRIKWHAWEILKSKIEAKESFDTELQQFNDIFADQPKIKKMVAELLSSFKVVNLLPDAVRKYINCHVTLSNASPDKIRDISFNILLSFFNELGE